MKYYFPLISLFNMNLINSNQGIFEGETSQEMVIQRILIRERVFINCWQVVNGPDGRKDF